MPHSATLVDPSCLTDELLAGLVDGRLTAEELARVHEHAARCKDCCELLVAVARGGLSQEVIREPLLEPLSSQWNPPEEFQEFRLLRPLGRGAMGVVYLAHDRSLDRQVAVKFIAAPQPEARARERFQTEARAIARLKHANVVTVFRVGEAEGHPYIVSEYLTGHSLAELASPLPWRRALGLGIGLARGLAAAHRQGVLHRDLKPDNVFLTTDGEVKLLDFGLAELMDTGGHTGPSRGRSAAGTPRYMAPELFSGLSATPQSDLYALGLILYELCAGTLPSRHRPGQPLTGEEPAVPALMEHPGQVRGPPLAESVQGIAPEFASIIERCLRIEPAERFASAEALCEELEKLEPLYEPEALPAGNPYRGLAPFEAEHRALFFGRDADIRSLIDRLRRQPLVLVTGDSGVGKSSLCRAGILSRVVRGALHEYRDFSTLTLEPSRRPLAALAAALAPILGQTEAELMSRLAEPREWLGPELRKAYPEGRGLLLFVDQLEELVTLSEPTEAVRFASLLGELALPAEGVRVLLAVRGDFLTRVGSLPGLRDAVERALYLLRPLTLDGVREAIVGPARNRGVVFESEVLLQTLAGATAQGAGSLPLLQFTLAELWERRDSARGCITQAALDSMGGVAGALSRHADGVLARLDRAEQQAARLLLGRLITVEGTRSARSEEELTAGSGPARAALQALLSGRLLHARTEAGRASYEIAHEALIASWGTLRHWLDDDAGQRALRHRLEDASAEWERLGHAEDLLWRKRQLGEALALDPAILGPREQRFLRTSMSAMRRQSVGRWLAALLLPLLMAAAIYGAQRLQVYLRAPEYLRARLEDAQREFSKGRALSQTARATREKALGLFNDKFPEDSGMPLSPQGARHRAEQQWGLALTEFEKAQSAFTSAEKSLDDALELAPDHPEVRRLLMELILESIQHSQAFLRADDRARLQQRFVRLASKNTDLRNRLEAQAEFELTTTPLGARVELTPHAGSEGEREQSRFLTTPVARTSLPAGGYHLRITQEGRAPIEMPLLLEHGQHKALHLSLPKPRDVPEGYVYVPPDCFFAGSADPEDVRKFLLSAPLHQRCFEEGYLIGKTEVTLRDWMEYLDSLPKDHPAQRILAEFPLGGGPALRLARRPSGGWNFSLRQGSGRILEAREGEPFRYPERIHRKEQDWRFFPLAGVSAKDLQGYFTWLDSSGRVPGARLCQELEWVRAARGADDRRYPHGNRMEDDDANLDLTYGAQLDARGPDQVGLHPASASPFGLLDMAGNVFEMATPTTKDIGDIVILGGAWHYGSISTVVANRQAYTDSFHDARVGARVCASLPAR
jgi:serine/threonine protein kinase/formylglycine-generating enzyme required for sulfatase activity